jgi:hypothetical protein
VLFDTSITFSLKDSLVSNPRILLRVKLVKDLEAIKPYQREKKAKQAYIQFEKDPWYPGLHFKRVHSRLPIYSICITKDYRAVSFLWM